MTKYLENFIACVNILYFIDKKIYKNLFNFYIIYFNYKNNYHEI